MSRRLRGPPCPLLLLLLMVQMLPLSLSCGAGKRGQMAMEYLLEHGFAKVINGGGPKETACWNEFGDK